MKTRRQFIESALVGSVTALAAAHGLAVAGAADTPSLSEGVAPKGVIDWHNHWLSPRSVEILQKRKSAPLIKTNSDGSLAFVSDLTGPGGLTLAPEFTDVEARLRHLNRVGVARQVISWPTTLGADAVLDAAESREIWAAYNEDLADLVAKHPDRFSGLATLPTSDIIWAAAELERAHAKLGLIGAVLPVGAFQSLDGARQLSPIFDVAQKHGSHIYLHTGPASPSISGQVTLTTSSDDAPAVRGTLERSLTFARGAVTLTRTDFLDAYPDVTIQIAMLGGAASVLSSWLLHNPRGRQGTPSKRLFDRVYVDTGVFGRSPELLAFATEVLGADRVLFGSDFPLAPTDRTLVALAHSAIGRDEKQSILVDNGQSLFSKITRPRSANAANGMEEACCITIPLA